MASQIYSRDCVEHTTAAASAALDFTPPKNVTMQPTPNVVSGVVNQLAGLVLDDDRGPLPLHWRGQASYEKARVGRIFNQRRPQRYPPCILTARNQSDVVRGVKLAAERGLHVAVRSGGHSWAGLSVRDKSMLIDLGELRELQYDDNSRIVTASPAITGGELNPYLAQWGRFFAGGHCPSVGIGGFLLQGGQGWGARGWGWSCEQIESIDVVTADGQLLTCSERENSDLFWCARGSGPGFFAVVIRFRLRTRHIPLAMHHTTLIIPAVGNIRKLLPWWFSVNRTMDPLCENVCLAFARGRIFPEECNKTGVDPLEAFIVLRSTTLTDDDEHAKNALAPMLECPVLDKAVVKIMCAPTSMAEEYAQQLADNPPARYFVDNAWIHGNDEDCVDSIAPVWDRLPSLQTFVLHYSMAPLRPLPDMLFSLQTEHYLASYVINADKCDTPADSAVMDEGDARCRKWIADIYSHIDSKGNATGGSIGQYTGDSELSERPSRILSDAHFDKYVTIKRQWDPKGMFCGYEVKKGQAINKASWELGKSLH